jgi:hypothetical protein
MAIGIGIALNNAVACLEALTGHESPFVRTPKYNRTGGGKVGSKSQRRVRSPMSFIPIPSMRKSISILELAMGVYMLECARLSVEVHNTIVSLPFLLLFAGGYLYVGLTSLWVHLRGWMDGRKVAAAAAAA